MYKYKVVVTDLTHKSFEIEKKILKQINAKLVLKHCTTEQQLIELTYDADAVIVNLAKLTAEVINNMKKCKIIARYGVGYDNVDLPAAKKKNIYVTNVPDYCTEEVSDHIFGLLFTCIRQIDYKSNIVKSGEWNKSLYEIHRVKGSNLGLIGYGRIAKLFYKKIKNFNLNKIYVYNSHLKKINDKKIEAVSLKKLLRESDYIIINLPLTKETKNMIKSEEFNLMKKNAILINTSRGGIINEKDLYKALKTNKIACAGLDVFEKEPPDKNNALFKLDNIVLTDHSAWYSKESVIDLKTKVANNVVKVLTGKKPENIIA